MRLKRYLQEAITLDIEIGDTVLGGKFKNKRVVVKEIGKNEKGDWTINGKPLLKFRILPKEEVTEASKTCWKCGAKERKWGHRTVDGKDYCNKCFKKLPKEKQEEWLKAHKQKDKDLEKRMMDLLK